MEEDRVNAIMDDGRYTEDSSLCIIREALEQYDEEHPLRCFLDGNALCVVKPGFVNIQESDAFFKPLSKKDLQVFSKFVKK